MQIMDFMTNQDSYSERRQLFKNIWETAMNIDDKDDIMNKPKVIKTLRLDDVDKCVVGKKKKQRIKNLRHVCNRILEFCDRQDAEDVIYEQMAADEHQMPSQAVQKIDIKPPRKTKTHKMKKKVQKAKSMLAPTEGLTQLKATASEQKDEFPRSKMKTPSTSSPMRIKRTTFAAKVINIKPKPSSRKRGVVENALSGDNKHSHVSAIRRRNGRQKPSKRKKLSDSNVQATSSMKTKHQTGQEQGHAVPRVNPAEFLQTTKLMIN